MAGRKKRVTNDGWEGYSTRGCVIDTENEKRRLEKEGAMSDNMQDLFGQSE